MAIMDNGFKGIHHIDGIILKLWEIAVILCQYGDVRGNVFSFEREQVDAVEGGIRMAMGQIQHIGTLTRSEINHDIAWFDIFRHGVGLEVCILIGETAIGRHPEMHKAILGMVMPVSPMINAVIGTDLFDGILVTLDKFIEVDEFFHCINLGMQLIKTVFRIHRGPARA